MADVNSANLKLAADLRRVGLQEKTAQVYAALFELGGAYPSKISEYTKLNRSTVYKILEDLAIKGLVNEVEKGKKLFYQLEKPEKIMQFARDQIRLAEEREEKAAKILPELEGLYSLTAHRPKVKFYEGLSGVLEVYADHVNVSAPYEMLAWSNASGFIDFAPLKFRNEYMKKKEKTGITTRGIVPDTATDKNYNKTVNAHIAEKYWPEMRFVPAGKFPYNGEITIYGKNKISLINFKKPTYIGVIIEDQDIHDMMVMIFELAWQGAK